MDVLIIVKNNIDKLALKYVLHLDKTISYHEVDTHEVALEKAKQQPFDIIFIDAGLGTLEDFALIRAIRDSNLGAFLICLSKDTSSTVIRKLITSGADRILEKPIKTILLKTQFLSCLKLLRQNSIFNQDSSINLFNDDVFSMSMSIKITNQNELLEFKNQYCVCDIDENQICFDSIKNLASQLLGINKHFLVIIEESLQYRYFTFYVPSIAKITFDSFIQNCNFEFKTDRCKLSLKIKATSCMNHTTVPDIKPKPIDIAKDMINNTPQELIIFDFIDDDELGELIDEISELESMLSILIYSNLNKYEVFKVLEYFSGIHKILIHHPETFDIAQAIKFLIDTVRENLDIFIIKSKSMSTVILGLCSDLILWEKSLFLDGAPDAYFMNDSLISNIMTIINTITPQENNNDTIDF